MGDSGSEGWFRRWRRQAAAVPLQDGSFPAAEAAPTPVPVGPTPGQPSSATPTPTPSFSPALPGSEPAIGDVLRARGSYRVVSRLGKGASASVWRAEDVENPARAVALKVLVPDPAGYQDLTFKRELSSLLAIDSPRIPKVLDWRLDGDHPFVVMPYFPRGSLRDVLRVQGCLDEAEAWRLLRDLLEALVVAHQASVLHLDIKPANVLLDADDRFLLADFGVSQGARLRRGILPKVPMGTPGYQAPEQRWLDPERFDMRTDLYSVGATVWSAVVGLSLASKRSEHLLAKSPHEAYGLPPLRELRPFIGSEFESLVMRLLRQNPHDRPGSAAEMLSAMADVLDGLPAERSSGGRADPQGAEQVLAGLVDPLWAHVLAQGDAACVRRFLHGETLGVEGERAWVAYLLLRGTVRVDVGGRVVARESREGTFLGEVATLTGGARTATMTADGDVWAYALNASQLEWLVTANPAVGIRLIRSMAERLSRRV